MIPAAGASTPGSAAVNGVAVPAQLPVDEIGFTEYRRQTLGHVAQIR